MNSPSLIIGRQWRSQVEWYAHAPLAAKAGLSPQIIADLKANKRPANMSEEEAVVYDFVTELTTKHAVSDELFAKARKHFNDQQLVDLTSVAGAYVSVAMLLAMAEETVPIPAKKSRSSPASRRRLSAQAPCCFAATCAASICVVASRSTSG